MEEFEVERLERSLEALELKIRAVVKSVLEQERRVWSLKEKLRELAAVLDQIK